MKVHTGYGKKDKHGHMMEHVKKMLAIVKSGVIKRPSAPLIPEMEIRPHGDIALGSRTEEGNAMTEKRHRLWEKFMVPAQEDPEKYSRWVTLPKQDGTLEGSKIEVRIMLDAQNADGSLKEDGDGKQVTFLHCFEGTVEEVRTNKKSNTHKFGGETSKWAIAKIKWDVEFLQFCEHSYHALNPELYAKENKNGGWNVPNEEYLLAVQCAADKFEELRAIGVALNKQKGQPGDGELRADLLRQLADLG